MGRVGTNRIKQPPSQEGKINTKNAKVPTNPDMRRHKVWNSREIPWHTTSAGTDEVKIREHTVPRSLKHAEGIQGTKVTMLPLCAWTVYPLCKIMMGVISRRRLLKPNKAINEMGDANPQTQRPITHTKWGGIAGSDTERRPRNHGNIHNWNMATASTATKLGTDRTPPIVHCTRNNKSKIQIATTVYCLEERLCSSDELYLSQPTAQDSTPH